MPYINHYSCHIAPPYFAYYALLYGDLKIIVINKKALQNAKKAVDKVYKK
jgi:hypothetical protein